MVGPQHAGAGIAMKGLDREVLAGAACEPRFRDQGIEVVGHVVDGRLVAVVGVLAIVGVRGIGGVGGGGLLRTQMSGECQCTCGLACSPVSPLLSRT